MIKMKTLVHLAFVLSVLVSQGHSTVRRESQIYKLVYTDFLKTEFDYCIRLFNQTHEFGCQSSQNGNVGILHEINNQAALDKFVSDKNLKDDYAVFVEETIFKKTNLLALLQTKKVSGILVYAETKHSSGIDWSPESKCPRYRPELYNNSYGKDYQACSHGKKNLNPLGNGMLDISIPIPVFYISKPDVKKKLFDCMKKHNLDNEYPYCGVEMKSFMNGAGNSKLCSRRTSLFLVGTVFCTPIGGHNVIGSLKNLKDKKRHDTILVTSPMDARSFMVYNSGASNADTATGFITTLAVARALGKLTKTEKDGLDKNIVFTLVDGEAFDGTGGKRMLKDLETGNFPVASDGVDLKDKATIKIEDVKNIVELRELGLLDSTSTNLFAHYDPIAFPEGSAKEEITKMTTILTTAAAGSNLTVSDQTAEMGIPPSTIQTILRSHTIPSLLLTEYDAKYTNKRHLSRYDNLNYLLGDYHPPDTSETDMLDLIKPLAKRLEKVADTVANGLYMMAASDPATAVDRKIKSDPDEIAKLIYCFLHNSNCSHFTNFLPSSFSLYFAKNEPLLRYTSSSYYRQSPQTSILQGLLHSYLGEEVAEMTDADSCQKKDESDLSGINLFYKNNPKDGKMKSGICLWASVFSTSGELPEDEDGAHWTESGWDSEFDSIKLRMFIIQDEFSQGIIMMSGLVLFLCSSVLIFFLNRNGSILFRNGAIL